ncbi:MAG: hypothetical protein WAR76_24035 [Xanthobacteraceae bacterium]
MAADGGSLPVRTALTVAKSPLPAAVVRMAQALKAPYDDLNGEAFLIVAQAAKIIRQLEEVVLVGDARDMKKKRKPQKPQK